MSKKPVIDQILEPITCLSVIKAKAPNGLEVSLANLPNNGNTEALNVLKSLVKRHPHDYLMTTDGGISHQIGRMSGLPTEPIGDDGQYQRMKVRMRTGHGLTPVEVANVPATQNGKLLLDFLIVKFPRKLFHTTDFGMLLIGDIDPSSIESLNEIAWGC